MKMLAFLPILFSSLGLLLFAQKDIPGKGYQTYKMVCVPLLVKKPDEKITIRSRLPGDSAVIQNPYYRHRVWRLWFKDSSPVEFSRDSDRTIFSLPEEEKWNDGYMSLDYGHSDGILKPQKNYFTAPVYHHASLFAPPELLSVFGVNYTAESLTSRGRYIMDDQKNNGITERNFFFANVVRASCAYICYSDTFPDKVYDEYDALMGHSFHSIGHSGSMMIAIKKMIDAGEYIPRETREMLKTNGLYAPAMLTLFKMALPWTDARGRSVSYDSELRHRPVYSMSGNWKVYENRWFKANIAYHQYDEKLHVRNMIELAKGMKVPPPVTVMDLTGMTVSKKGIKLVSNQTEDERIKSVNKTIIRIWGKTGETIEVGIDLGKSIDLTGRPLTFHGKVLYQNQKNVSIIKGDKEGIFRIVVRHDPTLPKGRIPVLFYATNGEKLPGNPVFVNFYWPEDGETQADYPHDPGSYSTMIPKPLLINNNKRPVVWFDALDIRSDTVTCEAGTKLSFRIHAKDPEGRSLTIYRWTGEPGKLSGNNFSWNIPADLNKTVPIHFIVSDGTGGYAGKTITVKIKQGNKR